MLKDLLHNINDGKYVRFHNLWELAFCIELFKNAGLHLSVIHGNSDKYSDLYLYKNGDVYIISTSSNVSHPSIYFDYMIKP